MIKKILITAFIGSNNLGDEAIFESVSQSLTVKKNLQLSAFTLNRKKNYVESKVRMIQTYNPFKIISEIKNCDILICGGGGLIVDKINIYNLLRHTYKIIVAHFLGKKYMFYAVGVDTLTFSFNKALVKFLCNNASAITVRDEKSKRNLLKLGISSKIIVTSDPAININTSKKKSKIEIPFQKPYLVVCLRHWFDINRYIPVTIVKKLNLRSFKDKQKHENFLKQMAKFLDNVVNNYKLKLIFLPFYYGRDEKIHGEVIDRMENKKECINITKQVTSAEANAIISKAEMLIGMRLHAQIFSAKNHIPFLSLTYAEKVAAFLEEIGFPEWGIDVDKLDKEKLIYKFGKIYTQRNILKNQLKKRIRFLKKRELINRQIFESLFNKTDN